MENNECLTKKVSETNSRLRNINCDKHKFNPIRVTKSNEWACSIMEFRQYKDIRIMVRHA